MTEVHATFGSSAYAKNACHIRYLAASKQIYLENDENIRFVGPITPGASKTVSNSQCTLNAAKSSVAGSGSSLTLNVAVNFKPTYTGQKEVYLYAIDNSGSKTAAWEKRGIWQVTK